jgi:hypothetical protein
MFLGEGQVDLDFEDERQAEDIYGVETPDTPEPRFKVEASVKRRKLSPSSDQPNISTEYPLDEPAISSKVEKQPKKVLNNPFLDDSSDEEEDVVGHQQLESLEDTGDDGGLLSLDSMRGLSSRRQADISVEARPPQPLAIPRQHSTDDDFADKSPELNQEAPENEDFGDFADLEDVDFAEDEEFDGEEFREMRYMQEQARLEAEASENYSCDEGIAQPLIEDVMTMSCPICQVNLGGITTDQATAHVNACLDGHPTPLPTPSKPAKTMEIVEVEAREVSKRFARAAVARPGQANPISLGAGQGKSAFAKLMSGHAEDAAWVAAAAAENASRGKPAYQRTCPFYKIMPGFFICVDAFRYGAVEGCKAYFLSHFHSDHYVGLTANWSHGPIYCSKVTGSLVKSQLRTAAKYVVELEFEEKVAVPGTEGVFVTMIPANHCPGSSLFLFEKAMGGNRTQRILHCGDFRACTAHVRHPGLQPETIDAITGKTKQQKIDVCYLDTTYLNPRYSFPPQDEVIRACAELCVTLDQAIASGTEGEWDDLLRRREGAPTGTESVSKYFATETSSSTDDNAAASNAASSSGSITRGPASQGIIGKPRRPRLLVICGTYSIGKERICKAIAQALGTKIFAPPAKARIVAQLGDAELTALLTANPIEAQVHMQMLMEIRAETLAEYLDSYRPHFSRIIGFRPTGWSFRPSAPAGGIGNAVGANMPPSSLPTTALLHGSGWRTRFNACDMMPQRGSSKIAACFGVPYSEHSSFRELALFLMALRIEKVVPTVNVGSEISRKRMKGWIDRWLAERRKGGMIKILDREEDSSPNTKTTAGLWDGKSGKGGCVYW